MMMILRTPTNGFCVRLMRSACFGLAIVASGCFDSATSEPRRADTPASLVSGPGFVWALVVDPSGACIAGATIYVVSGPYEGRTFAQDSNCDAWAYSGGVWFALSVGTTVTLRASAPGYTSVEKTAVAASSGRAVEFDLSPIP